MAESKAESFDGAEETGLVLDWIQRKHRDLVESEGCLEAKIDQMRTTHHFHEEDARKDLAGHLKWFAREHWPRPDLGPTDKLLASSALDLMWRRVRWDKIAEHLMTHYTPAHTRDQVVMRAQGVGRDWAREFPVGLIFKVEGKNWRVDGHCDVNGHPLVLIRQGKRKQTLTIEQMRKAITP